MTGGPATILITGAPGSATSLAAALLEQRGFRLGKSHPVLRKPGQDRPQGDLDNLGAVRVNDKILSAAGGAWNKPPSEERSLPPQGAAVIRQFLDRFDGDLIKDPRLCLTLPLWQAACRNLDRIILCIRNPASVVRSLEKRHFLGSDQGIMLWCEYLVRFARSLKAPAVILDYDQLLTNPDLVNRLPFASGVIDDSQVLQPACNEFPFCDATLISMPKPVLKLYNLVRSGELFAGV